MAHNVYKGCGPPSVFSLCQIMESGNHSNPFFCVCCTSANMINSIQLKVITFPRLGRSLYNLLFHNPFDYLSSSQVEFLAIFHFNFMLKKKNITFSVEYCSPCFMYHSLNSVPWSFILYYINSSWAFVLSLWLNCKSFEISNFTLFFLVTPHGALHIKVLLTN